MNSTSNPHKQSILLAGVVIVLALAALVSWAAFRPRALEPVKTISVSVTHGDGTVTSFEIETTARYLNDALDARELLDIAETEDGPVLLAVDGEYTDTEKGTYWLYTVNGSVVENTVEEQDVTDGDAIDFYLLTY